MSDKKEIKDIVCLHPDYVTAVRDENETYLSTLDRGGQIQQYNGQIPQYSVELQRVVDCVKQINRLLESGYNQDSSTIVSKIHEAQVKSGLSKLFDDEGHFIDLSIIINRGAEEIEAVVPVPDFVRIRDEHTDEMLELLRSRYWAEIAMKSSVLKDDLTIASSDLG